MTRTVAQKMGIKANSKALFINAPIDVLEGINLPKIDSTTKQSEEFDYIHLFVKSQTEFREKFPQLKPHLKLDGMLWVSWPKNKQLGTDLSITKVIEIGYESGLVESTALSINSVWSAIKFTHPKKGKEYHNSYGQLKERTTGR
ncbi:hypothetical protein [Emticicia sp. C21]|uniref:hypothetical protein n=1 Tax=Emticicia sp. C21 TaxID=2302915 RepID=UPI000E34DC69|nr:hypothetical protein [Emticicia sp. C21]RFS18615.1 hypothetical protein D0T08_00930 [Emticicia sp. C21]